MASEEKKIWGIHTLDDKLFLKENLIAIGWKEMGDLRSIAGTRDAFKDKYIEKYPDAKKGNVATGVGMLYRFCHEAQVGDYVVFPSKSNRDVIIGQVEGEYIYDSSQDEYVHTRKVKWLKHLPRTSFSQGASETTEKQGLQPQKGEISFCPLLSLFQWSRTVPLTL